MASPFQLNRTIRRVLGLTAKFQVSLLLSVFALSISFTQLYLTQFHAKSELLAFVYAFNVAPSNQTDHEGELQFDMNSTIAFIAINSGTKPVVLLRVIQYSPRINRSNCNIEHNLEWDFFSTPQFGASEIGGFAFPIEPQILTPGAISDVHGELHGMKASRWK